MSAVFFKKPLNKWLIGLGMVPRGEVGLIFAAVGMKFGVINDEVFSMIIIMVIITTIFTPVMLKRIIEKEKMAINPI